jgi:hypothetical protein
VANPVTCDPCQETTRSENWDKRRLRPSIFHFYSAKKTQKALGRVLVLR